MKVNLPKKKAKAVMEVLKERFEHGERLSVKEITEEFFPTSDRFTYLQALAKVRGWMHDIKIVFKSEGMWFGNVDDQGSYGLPRTEGEYRYIMTRYYNFTKGIITNATIAASEAENKGLLTLSRESIKLPKLSLI